MSVQLLYYVDDTSYMDLAGSQFRTEMFSNGDGGDIGEYSIGFKVGLDSGSQIGIIVGQRLTISTVQADAYEEGKRDSFSRGVAVGRLIATGDSANPTVTITSLPATNEDPVIVQVYDNTGLRLVQLTCQDRTDGPKQIVYDDTGFQHPFGGKSTVTGSGTQADPFIFTIYRRGRWPTGISLDFKARAIDTAGNQGSAS